MRDAPTPSHPLIVTDIIETTDRIRRLTDEQRHHLLNAFLGRLLVVDRDGVMEDLAWVEEVVE